VGAAKGRVASIIRTEVVVFTIFGRLTLTASIKAGVVHRAKVSIVTAAAIVGTPTLLRVGRHAGQTGIIRVGGSVFETGSIDHTSIRTDRVGAATKAIADVVGTRFAIAARVDLTRASASFAFIGVGAGVSVIAGIPFRAGFWLRNLFYSQVGFW
jgi:hypothetical protein